VSIKIEAQSFALAVALSAFREDAMKLRICQLVAIAALVSCFLASTSALAQNAHITNQDSAAGIGREPVAFGQFIQPSVAHKTSFAGTPGFSNCEGQSVAALDRQFGGPSAAAAVGGFSDVQALENAVLMVC
jgi:hypothetical protein